MTELEQLVEECGDLVLELAGDDQVKRRRLLSRFEGVLDVVGSTLDDDQALDAAGELAELLDQVIHFEVLVPGVVGVLLELVDGPAFRAVARTGILLPRASRRLWPSEEPAGGVEGPQEDRRARRASQRAERMARREARRATHR